MKIEISDHFTLRKLLKFAYPSIIMMLFTSIYGCVDGFFVTNFVGEIPFAAINLTWPIIMIFGGIGFVFGTGGNAIIATALGEGNEERARRYFSLIVYTSIVVGIAFGVIGYLFKARLSAALGAEGELLDTCIVYLSVLFFFTPFFLEQNMFQSLCSTAGKPKLGLIATICAGVGNFVLDYFAIVVFKWGTFGAALATGISQFFGGIIPLIYFMKKNDSYLKLGKTKFEGKVLLKTCTNGASEFVNNLTLSIIIILFNLKLIELAGQDGVNSFGIIQYIEFIFLSIFLGLEMASAPIISYNNGAKNLKELQNIFKKDIGLLLAFGAILLTVGHIFARPFSMVFANNNETLINMTVHGFRLFAIAILTMGATGFTSTLFTALGNGWLSALLSFLKSFVLPIIVLNILPNFLGLNGIWLSQLVIEIIFIFIAVPVVIKNNKRYHYIK